jgi:hypothetical protein
MKNLVTLNEINYADLGDIGQFAVSEDKWNLFTEEQFELMGEKIVNEVYEGDVEKAYDELVNEVFI